MTEYVPPKVWTWDTESGGTFASINRPIAGATHDKALPVGKHPLQLYSLATPNGQKVTILLEELETVTQAIKMGEDLDHWLERLSQVNHALQSLENTLFMTHQEKATLRTILEFHEGAFDGNEDEAPYDVRAYESLLAKVRPGRRA